MFIAKSISEVRNQISIARKEDMTIGFVPTMGALHQGHISLVEISKKKSDFTVMSIFVNPIQFNDKNDLKNYPKPLDLDIEKAKNNGVDLLFMPGSSEMYKDLLTTVNVGYISETLCGASRKGHFEGVCTVVSKLFNIIQPDYAIFGQKDIQQLSIIEKMTNDLNFPIEIIRAPIKREEDGLAMSSRNIHLKSSRKNALSLYNSLKIAEKAVNSGEKNSSSIIKLINDHIASHGNPEKIEYISIVDYNTLHEIENLSDKSIIALAVYFDNTRLIDNMIIDFTREDPCIY